MITLPSPILLNGKSITRVSAIWHDYQDDRKLVFMTAGMRRPLVIAEGDGYNPDWTGVEAEQLVKTAAEDGRLQSCFDA